MGNKKKGRKQRKAPSPYEAENDSELLELLDRADLKLSHVIPDGNCLFRAFASQFVGDQKRHLEFRDACCEFMERSPTDFAPFVDQFDLQTYLNEMRASGTWGTQLEIVALCKRFSVDCVIFRQDGVHYKIECGLTDIDGQRILMLSHHDEEHFNEVRFKEKGRVLSSFDELERLLAPRFEEPTETPDPSLRRSNRIALARTDRIPQQRVLDV